MSDKIHIFDIETSPRADLVSEFVKPFKRDDVKLGNLKDPDKIAAKLETAEADYWRKANDKAALDPFTSEICAIGVHMDGARVRHLLDGSEVNILNQFWGMMDARQSDRWAYYTGSNNKSAFDPRHIICRSWVNKVPVPVGIVADGGFISRCFVDLSQVFLAGADYPSFVGADLCAKQLGLIGEDVGFATVKSKDQLRDSQGLTGANFWKFWSGDADEKSLAADYLTNDLAIERAIANRILS